MARPRQFDEDAVLTAVCDQFWDAGYAATSLQDLMQVSGLGKGSLYAAFGDKHALFLQALRRYTESLDRGLRASFDEAPSALEALRSFVMSPVGDPEGAAARRGCLLANSTTELASSDPDVAAEARRAYEATTALLAECVERAQHEGDLPGSTDPVATARALLAAQQGLTFMGRSGMDVGTLRTTARTLADELLPAPPVATAAAGTRAS
ncbi:TetR/AcrR family transcriptional regulator [Brachybacterium sp. NBEC-018]|uniref:TetR/AcrR family transcriptional regulator n=1 Tax=Brachybacterium sp. NBEC-018 TaxID=2996004 RepID=UPI00217500DE|nr:TetR/AcrR family transcriptional regulator [Brachybacterium sp. NBEC-018]UVY85350.1 TetR/AcrR family transcriptional regulator [Brachybacterium sp. NBEC-018]